MCLNDYDILFQNGPILSCILSAGREEGFIIFVILHYQFYHSNEHVAFNLRHAAGGSKCVWVANDQNLRQPRLYYCSSVATDGETGEESLRMRHSKNTTS